MPKPLKGSFKKNPKKDANAARQIPDFKGSYTHEDCQCGAQGGDYWVSAWKNVSDEGEAYITLSMTKKDDQAPRAGDSAHNESKRNGYAPKVAPLSSGHDMDDIPF